MKTVKQLLRDVLLDAALRDRNFERCQQLTSPGWENTLILAPKKSGIPSGKAILSLDGKLATAHLLGAVPFVFVIDEDEADLDWAAHGIPGFRTTFLQFVRSGYKKHGWLPLDTAQLEYYRSGYVAIHPVDFLAMVATIRQAKVGEGR